MWLSKQISSEPRKSVSASGKVTGARGEKVIVQGLDEYRGLPLIAPWGIEYFPPNGAKILALTGDGACLGTILEGSALEPGELRLFSLGGAEILLKNTGEVLINGQSFPKQEAT